MKEVVFGDYRKIELEPLMHWAKQLPDRSRLPVITSCRPGAN